MAYENLIRNLQPAVETESVPQGLFSQFFPVDGNSVIQSDIVEIDYRANTAGVAQIVNPNAMADVTKKDGYETKLFKLPTLKDLYVVTPNDIKLKGFGGTVYDKDPTKAMKYVDSLVNKLKTRVERKREIMAIESAFNGTLAINGIGEKRTLDFGRDSSLTITLSGTSLWSNSASTPMANIMDWTLKMSKFGRVPTDVIGASATMQKFIANAEVKALLDNRRYEVGGVTYDNTYLQSIGAIYLGTYAGVKFWSYDGVYINNAGASTSAVPAGKVVLMSRVNENRTVLGYAGNMDIDYGGGKGGTAIDAQNFLIVPEIELEPSMLKLTGISTSAPLLLDPNSTLVATVL